jgi:HNH endonuclease
MSTAEEKPRQCLYCEKIKAVHEFSLEHIFPQSMGGALCSDIFKTRHVCARCNSIMGIFVDGSMIRNWFTKNAEAQAFRDFVDLDADNSWAPFTYMGPSDFLTVPYGDVLEIWMGASGEHIYHVHEKDDERYDTYVGGDPIRRNSDPGRAYLFLRSTEDRRVGLTLRSFQRQFKDARRYAGNFEVNGQSEGKLIIHEPSESILRELHSLAEKVNAGADWHIKLQFQLGFEQRFLAKVARSIGFNIFGSGYLETKRARDLRDAMWEKEYETRSRLLGGIDYFANPSVNISDYLGVDGGYSIILQVINDALVLLLTMPSGETLAVVISDTPQLWSGEGFNSFLTGVMYIIVPQIGFFHGPLPFPEFLAYKLGNYEIPELYDLERRRKSWPTSST